MATVLHGIEGGIPLPFVIPGVKLGLANIITLVALVMLGVPFALAVALMRTLLGALLVIGFGPTFLMSLSGALLSWAVMSLLYRGLGKHLSLVGISVAGAVAHIAAQLTVAALILKHPGTMMLFPVLMVSAVITGILVGITAKYSLVSLQKIYSR
jgi:heptaprenyl diphosphate synthase